MTRPNNSPTTELGLTHGQNKTSIHKSLWLRDGDVESYVALVKHLSSLQFEGANWGYDVLAV